MSKVQHTTTATKGSSTAPLSASIHLHLELHPDKTCLIESGRHAATNRRRRGQGLPETLDLVGIAHGCVETRKGKLIVLRQTQEKGMRRKLKGLMQILGRLLHDPIESVGAYLRSVPQGHCRYWGVARNRPALHSFRHAVAWLWWRSLWYRCQRGCSDGTLRRRWRPTAHTLHPCPEQRLRIMTQEMSPVR